MTRSIWIVALTLFASPALAADEKNKPPVERSTNDRQILDTLTEIHDKGATLYDGGDHAGCYRLFQGALMAVRTTLPREFQSAIDAGLADAGRLPGMSQRAMYLHVVIEETRKKLRPTAGPKVKGILLPAPRPVDSKSKTAETLPLPAPDNPMKIDSPVGPPIPPVNTPNKGTPAPVTTAPPSDDPPMGPKLPFIPIIPKPDGK